MLQYLTRPVAIGAPAPRVTAPLFGSGMTGFRNCRLDTMSYYFVRNVSGLIEFNRLIHTADVSSPHIRFRRPTAALADTGPDPPLPLYASSSCSISLKSHVYISLRYKNSGMLNQHISPRPGVQSLKTKAQSPGYVEAIALLKVG